LRENEMTNLWRIRAELKFDGHVRRVHYKIESVREYAYPSLDIIFSWCKDACEKLLPELKEKKADEKDLEYVEKEIEFLNGYQVDWKANHEKK
jgi:hypothetical protein